MNIEQVAADSAKKDKDKDKDKKKKSNKKDAVEVSMTYWMQSYPTPL